MTKKTSTRNSSKTPVRIATNVLFSTFINLTSAIAVSMLLSSCTIGAGGAVLGLQSIQDSYTKRLQVIEYAKKDSLSERDRAELTALINSLK